MSTVITRHLERAEQSPAGIRQFFRDLRLTSFSNAIIGFCFAASGPVAVILSVGASGGLAQSQIASWIFAVFFLNGLLGIAACLYYRTPLVFFWTIPGTVLIGPALQHLSFAEVVGACYITGLLMLLLGLSGWVSVVMRLIPMPIVMAMVAGVFLQFGLDWVHAVHSDIAIAGVMTLVFIILSALPVLGRWLPPVIGALLSGIAAVWWSGEFVAPTSQSAQTALLILPQIVTPVFSWQAIAELVLPLAITVIMVQNGQGIVILRAAGHQPPVNTIAVTSGIGTMMAAIFGGSPTCLTGPTNALISSSGEKSSHYTAGVIIGLFALAFGLFAPTLTGWMLATPPAFIAALAGIALFKVLQASFASAFGGKYQLGALMCFLVTVSELAIFRIGAPFWGLVFGTLVSLAIERQDFDSTKETARADD